MNERLDKIWNDPRRTPVLIGLIAFNIGTGFGYILGQRKKKIVLAAKDTRLGLELNINELDEIQIAKRTKEALSETPKVIVFPPSTVHKEDSLEVIKENFDGVMSSRKAKEISKIDPIKEEPAELVTRSVFTNKDDEWSFAKEVRERSPDEPYVIHRDEFFSEENDYTSTQFTYYAGDNILCDDNNAPVYNHEQVTGPLLFGHGSGDPNVVYIRNDKRKAEYEVLLDQGLYSTEVLGLEIEDNQRVNDLRHTRNRRVRPEDNE